MSSRDYDSPLFETDRSPKEYCTNTEVLGHSDRCDGVKKNPRM